MDAVICGQDQVHLHARFAGGQRLVGDVAGPYIHFPREEPGQVEPHVDLFHAVGVQPDAGHQGRERDPTRAGRQLAHRVAGEVVRSGDAAVRQGHEHHRIAAVDAGKSRHGDTPRARGHEAGTGVDAEVRLPIRHDRNAVGSGSGDGHQSYIEAFFGVVAVLFGGIEPGELARVVPLELNRHFIERRLGLPAAGGNEDDDRAQQKYGEANTAPAHGSSSSPPQRHTNVPCT